jgi:alpha-tubulin N-acetyltransferase 1
MTNIKPRCVLDFYVHESLQRRGIGSEMFEFMLSNEKTKAFKMAYDRPSPKLLAFLSKYYGLNSYSPQVNNFVVYD